MLRSSSSPKNLRLVLSGIPLRIWWCKNRLPREWLGAKNSRSFFLTAHWETRFVLSRFCRWCGIFAAPFRIGQKSSCSYRYNIAPRMSDDVSQQRSWFLWACPSREKTAVIPGVWASCFPWYRSISRPLVWSFHGSHPSRLQYPEMSVQGLEASLQFPLFAEGSFYLLPVESIARIFLSYDFQIFHGAVRLQSAMYKW